MKLPKRKPNRLKDFDYSTNGAYFITICTKDRKSIFWNKNEKPFSLVGAIIDRPLNMLYSTAGNTVDSFIQNIHCRYPYISVDYYAIMPNHVHLLLRVIHDDRRSMIAPTISTVIQQFKGAVSKALGLSIWQRSFYDHVIRNQQDYEEIAEYVVNNPAKWELDCFYTP